MPLVDTQPDAVARMYAKSLYELAEGKGGRAAVEATLGELEEILDLARGDAKFAELLTSRAINAEKRDGSLTRIFKGRVSDLTLSFLRVLNDKGRISAITGVVAAFDSIVQDKLGRVEVDVFTAEPMDASALASLKGRLRQALGKDVIVHPYTDAAMIGGVKLRIGDRLIDGSIATQLRQVKDALDHDGAAALRSRIGSMIEGGVDLGTAPVVTPSATFDAIHSMAVPHAESPTTGPAVKPLPVTAAAPMAGAPIHKKTVASLNPTGKRVLIRVDFNVPLEDGRITDDRRIREAVPTIRSVMDRGGRAILVSHMGRPEGKGYEAEYSLKVAATRLGELLGKPVGFPSQDCTDAAAAAAVAAMKDGEVVLLENLRFHKGEKKGDPAFAAKLAAYADAYVNDAFGTCHRPDASMVAVPKAMAGKPRVCGFLVEREIRFLSATLANPGKPFVVVLGGAKVSDKLGAIENLLPKADTILVGGAMAYTFLAAMGKNVGNSKVEPDRLADAKRIIDLDKKLKVEILYPVDHVCSSQFAESTGDIEVFEDTIKDGYMGLDIGPKTQTKFALVLRKAKTIVWNGPMGVFEWSPFSQGTRQVAKAIAEATKTGAVSIVGGGDSAAAVDAFGLADQMSHVSTGGGASLEMLEGKKFESVELLDAAN
ncbi:MAG: hypothetical protein HBSAPP03_01230 [Phycisphaerae bacterium]|nr:MAG: hypothetical protein HBSAPP03_01230 [Phycisphaerae bacterium]